MWRDTAETYGTISKTFHWVLFVGIIGLLAVGLYMTDLPKIPSTFKLYGLHKSVGITVLALVALRFIWRVTSKTPKLPEEMPWYEKLGARGGHGALYVLMFLMPLSGWVMSSASGFSVSVFGLFTAPDFVAPDNGLRILAKNIHQVSAWLLMGVIGIHAVAAFFHHFVRHDNVLKRMLPFTALLVLAASPAYADAPLWTMMQGVSKIEFTAKMNGAPSAGTFKKLDGEIRFDEQHPETSKVRITIDTTELETGYPAVAETLVTDTWFDSKKYPTAVFDCSNFEPTGVNQFIAHGKLMLRGVVKPVDLPFTLTYMGAHPDKPKFMQAKMVGQTTIKRSDFGVGQGEWRPTDVVADDVVIKVEVTAERLIDDNY